MSEQKASGTFKMQINSHSAEETLDTGRLIARSLKRQEIICLFGQLGSGKTVLTAGIARGLGIRGEGIISPSFVLIREYLCGRLPLYHFDLYRLKDCKEIFALGYEEYLYRDGVAVIEWADRLQYLLPKEYLKIELFIRGEKKRLLKFTALGKHYRQLLGRIDENLSR